MYFCLVHDHDFGYWWDWKLNIKGVLSIVGKMSIVKNHIINEKLKLKSNFLLENSLNCQGILNENHMTVGKHTIMEITIKS